MNWRISSSGRSRPAFRAIWRISSGAAGGRWVRSFLLSLIMMNAPRQSRQRRVTAVPIGCLLVGMGDAQHQPFGERRGGDLQRQREALLAAEAARDGKRRQAADTERHRDAGRAD